MPGTDLTQAEADALMAMEKHGADTEQYLFPQAGECIVVPLVSADRRENFILDVSRGRIDLAKVKYQNRARQTVVLVRVELAGARHRNPDREWISCPHIHVYREGFGTKWASLLPPDWFRAPGDLWQTLSDFMGYCNVTKRPNIERGMFA